jgi:hypothetical protein
VKHGDYCSVFVAGSEQKVIKKAMEATGAALSGIHRCDKLSQAGESDSGKGKSRTGAA